MNTVMASFSTTVRHMTKTSQQNITEMFQRKNGRSHVTRLGQLEFFYLF